MSTPGLPLPPQKIVCLMGVLLLLAACISPTPQPVSPITGLPQGSAGLPWWNDTVFYEIFVRSFYDSNADGVGDFNGLTQKLDYLNDGNPNTSNDLGVTGLWLMPIHPSPSYHGYDVTDYFTTNPQYGSLEDFKQFLNAAHHRGIRVIIDLVLNHTSSQHPWFKNAQDPTSPYRDWYVWSPNEPGGAGWHTSSNGYYFGHFDVGMPDLNYANPDVTEQMYAVARFWLQDVGVDGFRLDAAKHLIEQGAVTSNSDATHTWFQKFRPYYKDLSSQALTIGEVWESSVLVNKYLGGNELDLAFDFDLAQAFVLSARVGKAEQTIDILARDTKLFRFDTPTGPLPFQFATFLTNHDQARVMTHLANSAEKGKIAASLLLTTPGVPFIYYGEEIGMLGKKPDELIRTPMQWSNAVNSGFSSNTPWETLNPDFPDKNVAAQVKDPNSLLAHYRSLIHLRNNHLALRTGSYLPVQACASNVIAYLRTTPSPTENILVLINLSADSVPNCAVSLSEGPLSGKNTAVPLLSLAGSNKQPAPLNANSNGGFDTYQPIPDLQPYQTIILQLLPDKPSNASAK